MSYFNNFYTSLNNEYFKNTINNINIHYIKQRETSGEIEVEIISYAKVECAELDEMWNFVNCKNNQRWLWLALDHNTRTIIAYTFGKRKDDVFEEFRKILEPFGITKFYSDNWKNYSKYLNPAVHQVGKKTHRLLNVKILHLEHKLKDWHAKQFVFQSPQLYMILLLV